MIIFQLFFRFQEYHRELFGEGNLVLNSETLLYRSKLISNTTTFGISRNEGG